MHRHAVEYSTYPRGPRSGPGYSVPVRHHLVDPIRPTRRHIAISPHGGLYAMPSLCGSASATREWFRAFAAHPFLACRPLRPRGVRHRYVPELRCRHGLRRLTTGSALPILPQSVPRGRHSWLHWFASATYVVHHICSGMWRRPICGVGAGNIPVDGIIEHLTTHILARLIGPRHQRRRIDHARRTVREAGYCRSLSGWTRCRGPRALPAAGKRRRAFPLDAESDRLGAALRGGGGSEPWRKHQLHTTEEAALHTHPAAQWAAPIGVYCQTVPKVWRALAAQHRRSAARQ